MSEGQRVAIVGAGAIVQVAHLPALARMRDAGPDACVPAPGVCDGMDNDCDGVIDNGFDLTQAPANCGACGYAGCQAYAEAIVEQIRKDVAAMRVTSGAGGS